MTDQPRTAQYEVLDPILDGEAELQASFTPNNGIRINEAGDVVEMIDRAVRVGILDIGQIDVGRIVKREKLARYMQTEPEGL